MHKEGKSEDSNSLLLFPFLLKINPNTLCIIQKFHSLVATTRKLDPVALMSHLLSKGLCPKEQWLGLRGCPQRLLSPETASWGRGLFQRQLSPPHPVAKVRYWKVPL